MIPLVAALTEEIAARKKAEVELRASEERYRDLFQNATIMIFTLDLQGNFTSINKRGEQVTGYTQEELLDRNIFQFLLRRLKSRSLTRKVRVLLDGEEGGAKGN